jgi:hypothetical protein
MIIFTTQELYLKESYSLTVIIMDTRQDKRDRFLRLAPQRTNAVLKALKVLGNCGNPHAYKYSEEEVNKIFSEIEKRLKITKTKFQHAHEESEFQL